MAKKATTNRATKVAKPKPVEVSHVPTQPETQPEVVKEVPAPVAEAAPVVEVPTPVEVVPDAPAAVPEEAKEVVKVAEPQPVIVPAPSGPPSKVVSYLTTLLRQFSPGMSINDLQILATSTLADITQGKSARLVGNFDKTVDLLIEPQATPLAPGRKLCVDLGARLKWAKFI